MLTYLKEKLSPELFEQVAAALDGEEAPSLAAAEEVRAAKEAVQRAKQGFALQLALERAGALDSAYLRDQLMGEGAFDPEGGLLNGGELLKRARERHPALFPAPRVEGVRPAESAREPIGSLAGMTLAQRMALYQQDPEGYRRSRGE